MVISCEGKMDYINKGILNPTREMNAPRCQIQTKTILRFSNLSVGADQNPEAFPWPTDVCRPNQKSSTATHQSIYFLGRLGWGVGVSSFLAERFLGSAFASALAFAEAFGTPLAWAFTRSGGALLAFAVGRTLLQSVQGFVC